MENDVRSKCVYTEDDVCQPPECIFGDTESSVSISHSIPVICYPPSISDSSQLG